MLHQCRLDALVTGLTEHRIEIDHCTVHLGVDIDGGDRHQLQPLVIDTRQLLGHDRTNGLAETGTARVAVARPSARSATGLASTRPGALFGHGN